MEVGSTAGVALLLQPRVQSSLYEDIKTDMRNDSITIRKEAGNIEGLHPTDEIERQSVLGGIYESEKEYILTSQGENNIS